MAKWKLTLIAVTLLSLILVMWSARFTFRSPGLDPAVRDELLKMSIMPIDIRDNWVREAYIGGGLPTSSHALTVGALAAVLGLGLLVFCLQTTDRGRVVTGAAFLVLIAALWSVRFDAQAIRLGVVDTHFYLDRWAGVVGITASLRYA